MIELSKKKINYKVNPSFPRNLITMHFEDIPDEIIYSCILANPEPEPEPNLLIPSQNWKTRNWHYIKMQTNFFYVSRRFRKMMIRISRERKNPVLIRYIIRSRNLCMFDELMRSDDLYKFYKSNKELAEANVRGMVAKFDAWPIYILIKSNGTALHVSSEKNDPWPLEIKINLESGDFLTHDACEFVEMRQERARAGIEFFYVSINDAVNNYDPRIARKMVEQGPNSCPGSDFRRAVESVAAMPWRYTVRNELALAMTAGERPYCNAVVGKIIATTPFVLKTLLAEGKFPTTDTELRVFVGASKGDTVKLFLDHETATKEHATKLFDFAYGKETDKFPANIKALRVIISHEKFDPSSVDQYKLDRIKDIHEKQDTKKKRT